MFTFSILAQLFVVERHRPRAANVGFSIPALGEIVVENSDIEPLLTTNMRGTFLRTEVSREGYVRHGFSECPLDQESILLSELCRVLVQEGAREKWDNTVSTVEDALEKMRGTAFAPKALVVPEYIEIPDLKTYIADLSVTDLPVKALVAAHPIIAGFYTRIGDYVSILVQKANLAFVVVV